MLYRTFPYGTRRRVRVISVDHSREATIIACQDDIELNSISGQVLEGYVCMYEPGTVSAKVGDRAILVFSKGGPTGGFWDYKPIICEAQ